MWCYDVWWQLLLCAAAEFVLNLSTWPPSVSDGPFVQSNFYLFLSESDMSFITLSHSAFLSLLLFLCYSFFISNYLNNPFLYLNWFPLFILTFLSKSMFFSVSCSTLINFFTSFSILFRWHFMPHLSPPLHSLSSLICSELFQRCLEYFWLCDSSGQHYRHPGHRAWGKYKFCHLCSKVVSSKRPVLHLKKPLEVQYKLGGLQHVSVKF